MYVYIYIYIYTYICNVVPARVEWEGASRGARRMAQRPLAPLKQNTGAFVVVPRER